MSYLYLFITGFLIGAAIALLSQGQYFGLIGHLAGL